MALTKQQIADYCRSYFDLDEDETPDALFDRWVEEGWLKIARKVANWPAFEDTVTLSTVAATQAYAFPALRKISAIIEPDLYGPLVRLAPQDADRIYRPTVETGPPCHWTEHDGQVIIWPIPDAVYDLDVRGYRDPTHPVAIAMGTAIDLPSEDSETVLLQWALYKVATHQDEIEQAAAARNEFEAELRGLAADENASVATPIVLNRRHTDRDTFVGRLRFPFEA